MKYFSTNMGNICQIIGHNIPSDLIDLIIAINTNRDFLLTLYYNCKTMNDEIESLKEKVEELKENNNIYISYWEAQQLKRAIKELKPTMFNKTGWENILKLKDKLDKLCKEVKDETV